MSDPGKLRKYADVGWFGLLHIATVVPRVLAVVFWKFTTGILTLRPSQQRKRLTAIAAIRYLGDHCSIAQTQCILPTSVETYNTWAAKKKLPNTTENLIDGTTLLWIGPKRTDRVVLYCHGGAYLFPLSDLFLSFWRYVQLELEEKNGEVGFAVLAYSLVPTAALKTHIRQVTVAVEHIIASGVHPSDLHIVGDSSGGNLITALLSHILHPFEGVRPIISLRAPIGGVYLMSPWVCMKSTSSSSKSNEKHDIYSASAISHNGDVVRELADLQEHQLPYLEPANAPPSWFTGLDTAVDRIFMSAGGSEMFRDDIIRFSQTLSKTDCNFMFVVQDGGIHDDPYLDFLVGGPDPKNLGTLTPTIIRWLSAGMPPAGQVE